MRHSGNILINCSINTSQRMSLHLFQLDSAQPLVVWICFFFIDIAQFVKWNQFHLYATNKYHVVSCQTACKGRVQAKVCMVYNAVDMLALAWILLQFSKTETHKCIDIIIVVRLFLVKTSNNHLEKWFFFTMD